MSVYVRYRGYAGPCWGQLEDGTLLSLSRESWEDHQRTPMQQSPADVVSTGTPEGVGPLQAGDTVEIRIEGIGSLTNPFKDGD